ncbi:MAG: TonB-dependent receptor [Gammaproteobacteria bacterium]|nr:TonB-dependent receptor [Gammaproteobacteria bacterium]
MKTIKRLGRLLLVAAFGLSALTVSQITTAASNVDGFIVGTVSVDGQGVSGATVTVTNPDTGFTRTGTTSGDGSFRFTSLPVGSYNVQATASAGNAARNGVRVSVGTGTTVNLSLDETADIGEVTVVGSQISPIDITSTESATILGEQTVDRIPVNRNLTDVALLAPGTTRGDTAFGNLASFGGSTVGENITYINGLNVTNFRNGLGFSTVPFEFYQEFQVKTGGYSAEFGRSTGGVINAVTKSGTNEYKYGFNLFFEPWLDDINGHAPDVYRSFEQLVGGTVASSNRIWRNNSEDEGTSMEANVYASGPIVKDKAFFYVIYNLRDNSAENYGETIFADTESDDDFWGMKLDWNLSSNHSLELTAFSDARTISTAQYDYDYSSKTVGALDGTAESERGGDNFIVKYTGRFTPDFSLSVSYGENEYSLQDTSSVDACPIVIDAIDGDNNGCWVNVFRGEGNEDTREAMRIDGEWFIGDHQLRFGLDSETNTSNSNQEYSGGGYWRYITTTPGATLTNGATVPAGVTEMVRFRYYGVGGSFETETSAIYVEDTWQVADDHVLRIGLRNETFENKNGNGDAFIDISNQLAPRLGWAWDAMGDGTLKVFANYGRYFLPVANNTNVRLAGSELFYEEYYTFTGINTADDSPTGITEVGSRSFFSNGTVPDVRETTDGDLDPMYQDEFLFGFLKELDSGWVVGTRVIFRDLKSTLEDITINEALIARGVWDGVDHYILTNPGFDAEFYFDVNADGVLTQDEFFEVSAEELGYPESERYYNAVEFLFERVWDGVWFLQGSYTWSQSYGNNEGYVRSDNGQDDAGLTTLFDFPELLRGAYGPLPNDRTHSLKLFGAYQFAPNWRVGGNFTMSSGRPMSAFGVAPEDSILGYGSEYFYAGGAPEYRGKRGETPATVRLDLSVDYDMTMASGATVNLGVDVFNVFNFVNATEMVEQIETDSGNPNYLYGLPSANQTPRYVRLRAQFDF